MITEKIFLLPKKRKREAEFLTPQMPELEKSIAELTSDLNDAKSISFQELKIK